MAVITFRAFISFRSDIKELGRILSTRFFLDGEIGCAIMANRMGSQMSNAEGMHPWLLWIRDTSTPSQHNPMFSDVMVFTYVYLICFPNSPCSLK